MIQNYMFRIFLGENVDDDSATRVNVYGGKYQTKLTTDQKTWDEITEAATSFGLNAVLVEVADGVKYQSHPEVAAEGAWEVSQLKDALARLRSLGLTPYPKLNFSTAHDAWLGVYSRMVSTRKYYAVVRDLIHEVIDIFDTPEMLHLGLDEEGSESQIRYDYACFRQFDLYWHDYQYFLECVREKGVRPCVAVDPFILNKEKFLEYTPKDTVIALHYTGSLYTDTAPADAGSEAYKRFCSFTELPALGYDVLPTFFEPYKKNRVSMLASYVNRNVPHDKVKAILITPPYSTTPMKKYGFFESFSHVQAAREALE